VREAATILASDQFFAKILNKVIEDTLRKANIHNIFEFDRRDT